MTDPSAGPRHVWVDGRLLGMGEGPSRRTAETAAAAQAMERLRTMTEPDGTAS